MDMVTYLPSVFWFFWLISTYVGWMFSEWMFSEIVEKIVSKMEFETF